MVENLIPAFFRQNERPILSEWGQNFYALFDCLFFLNDALFDCMTIWAYLFMLQIMFKLWHLIGAWWAIFEFVDTIDLAVFMLYVMNTHPHLSRPWEFYWLFLENMHTYLVMKILIQIDMIIEHWSLRENLCYYGMWFIL